MYAMNRSCDGMGISVMACTPTVNKCIQTFVPLQFVNIVNFTHFYVYERDEVTLTYARAMSAGLTHSLSLFYSTDTATQRLP